MERVAKSSRLLVGTMSAAAFAAGLAVPALLVTGSVWLVVDALAEEEAVPTTKEAGAAAETMPLNELVTRSLRPRKSGNAYFRFDAPSSGLLTLALRTDGLADVWMAVLDETGRTLLNGVVDDDRFYDLGLEHDVVPLPAAGRYTVMLATRDTEAEVEFVAGFLPLSDHGVPVDPQSKPTQALDLAVGGSRSGSLRKKRGDYRDWYRLRVYEDGDYAVTVVGSKGGVVFYRYAPDEFYYDLDYVEPVADEKAGRGVSTLEFSAEAGDVYYFELWPEGRSSDYRIAVRRGGEAEVDE
ncbi:MAG: PPC domain-containing protein [Planctomycetota bacterium]